MVNCAYVGNLASQIGDIEFDTIGQRAEFSETGFRDAVLGGAGFIPMADFDRVGFEAKELEQYGSSGMRCDPTDSFCRKVEIAQQIYRDIYRRLQGRDVDVLAEVAS